MNFIPKKVDVKTNFLDKSIELSITVDRCFAKIIEAFLQKLEIGKEYEIKRVRKKRSLDSNSFAWKICTEIANVVGNTKEDVYRDAISHVGVYETLQFNDTPTKSRFDAMNTFKQKWMANGEGWLTKTLDADKCIIQAYYGSSRYNTKEMSVLIDYLVMQGKQVGVQVLTQEQIELMKTEWGK